MELQEKEKALQNEIALNLSSILYATNALTVPHNILVGGILHIVKSYKDNTQDIGEWQNVGSKFLQEKKSSKSTKELQHQPQEAASNTNHAEQKNVTRTLIQLGSLVSISGLTSLLHIQEGEDLQFDMEAKDKAAMLLGALSELTDANTDSLSPSQQEKWKAKGIRFLKMRDYQNRS